MATVLDGLVGGIHAWHGLALGGDADDRYLFVGGRRVPVALADSACALAACWSLAESNSRGHAELGRRADKDQLTTVHNRGWFLRRLATVRPDVTPRSQRRSLTCS